MSSNRTGNMLTCYNIQSGMEHLNLIPGSYHNEDWKIFHLFLFLQILVNSLTVSKMSPNQNLTAI